MVEYLKDHTDFEKHTLENQREEREDVYETVYAQSRDLVEAMQQENVVVPYEPVKRYFELHEGLVRRTGDNERAMGFYERNGNMVVSMLEMFMDEDTGILYVQEMDGMELSLGFEEMAKMQSLLRVAQAKKKDSQVQQAQERYEKAKQEKQKVEDGGMDYIG